MGSRYTPNGAQQNGSAKYTPTALSRWSILSKQLPPVNQIKTIHVYDFDNTLFKTPLPNSKLWKGSTLGQLGSPEIFVNGGWWHDSRILAATGDGVEREEVRGWDGWWNENIVKLVQLSMEQKDALAVLLTGRAERGFSELIKRIVKSKGLEFDMIGLKPAVGPNQERFTTTMQFKQIFLETMMETYKHAEEIRIYEDRPRHVAGFRTFMTDYNKRQEGYGGQKTRGPIKAEVIQVADISTTLDPVVEVAEIQHLINNHNALLARGEGARRARDTGRLIIKKTVFFTSYMIDPVDSKRLLSLAQIPQNLPEADLKFHANNIMICPRPCPQSILEKVGGMNARLKWEVTGTACFENSIWAASVKPIPPTAKYHTDNPSPLVVLALRKGARPMDAGRIQNWQPVPPDKAYVFETVVGEKVLLRIEPEDPSENEYESLFANKAAKRKHTGDEGGRSHNNSYNGRNFHSGNHGNHSGGGRGGNRGGYRGNNTPNRGYRTGVRGGGHKGPARGGKGGYRSLDDVGAQNNSYSDNFPALGQGGSFQQQSQQQQGGVGPRPSGYGTGGPDLQNFY